MTEILELLQQSDLIAFNDLIKKSEGKMGVAVVLLAIMELLKDSLIKGIQNEPFGKIAGGVNHLLPLVLRKKP